MTSYLQRQNILDDAFCQSISNYTFFIFNKERIVVNDFIL